MYSLREGAFVMSKTVRKALIGFSVMATGAIGVVLACEFAPHWLPAVFVCTAIVGAAILFSIFLE